MSSIVNPQPELPAEEELVAYLDGELPPDDCRRVEARLAADAEYRGQLHGLDQAWEALDALPATRADDDFARTTMELVTVAAASDLAQHATRAAASGRRRMWWLAGAGVAAAVVGFVATRALLSRGDAALLADLPVIRQVDLLAQIEDVEFLRRLATGVPRDQLATDDAALSEELEILEWVNAPTPAGRQEWLEELLPEEKAELSAQANRFRALPRQERNRLRHLQDAIREADDAKQLQHTLVAYGQWLSRLTPGELEDLKEELSDASPDEKIDRVRRFVRQANQRASQQLSPQDAETLRRAVLAFAEERKTRMLREMRPRGWPERARRLEEPRGALMILGRELQDDNSVNELRERIVNQLSPEAQAHLESLRPWDRRRQLWQWVRDSLKPDWGPGELERFFATALDNNQRERLLNLPPGEMQAELERLYVASEFGFRGMGDFGPGPRNPPPPNGPGFRPEMDGRGRPGGPPPPGFFDRDRFDRGPDGPRGPQFEDRDGRRPPPHGPGPPPPPHERQEAI